MAYGGGSPYCSVADVQALNFARTIGVGSNPGPSQVWTFINMTAGEIDAVLTTKGYSVPVNIASFPEAFAILNSANAKGAWAMMEYSAPNSIHAEAAKAAYDLALKLLSEAKFSLDTPTDVTRAQPRGPWATFQPTGNVYDPTLANINQTGNGIVNSDGFSNPADPYFSRQMEF